MGVDVNKVQQKAAEEAAKAAQRASTGFKYWSPKKPKNRIRFMPPWKSCTHGGSSRCDLVECKTADQFWREIYVHWGIGADANDENGQSLPCPVRTPFGPKGTTCPVCTEVDRLRKTGDPVDAEKANDMRAKQRYYSNVVDLDDPVYTSQDVADWLEKQEDKTRECPFKEGDTKVQVFSYGPMIYKDLLDIFGEQDISDLATGRDVEIVKEGKERETKYRTRAVFTQTAFNVRSSKNLDEVIVNLDRLMPFVPPEEMSKALRGEQVDRSAGRAIGGAAKPAPQLPAASTAPAAQPQQPKPTPQPAAPPTNVVPKSLPMAEPDAADMPPCFKDVTTVNPKDAECVGGQKGQDIYDPCPGFQHCMAAKTAAEAPAQPKRRAAKTVTPTVPDTSQPQAVNDLEAEMRAALRGQQ